MGVYLNKKIGYLISNPSKKVFNKAYELQMKDDEQDLVNEFKSLKNLSIRTPKGLDIHLTKTFFNQKMESSDNGSLYDCIKIIETNDNEEKILITMPDSFHEWGRKDNLIDNIELLNMKAIYKEILVNSKIPPFDNKMYNLSSGKEINDDFYYHVINYRKMEDHKGVTLKKLKSLGFHEGRLIEQVGMKPPLFVQMILDILKVELNQIKPVLVIYNS